MKINVEDIYKRIEILEDRWNKLRGVINEPAMADVNWDTVTPQIGQLVDLAVEIRALRNLIAFFRLTGRIEG